MLNKIENLSSAKFVDEVSSGYNRGFTSGVFVCLAVPVCAPSTGFDIRPKRRAARFRTLVRASSSPKFSTFFCSSLCRKWKWPQKQNAIKSEWWRWQWLLEYNNFNNHFSRGAAARRKKRRTAARRPRLARNWAKLTSEINQNRPCYNNNITIKQ